LTDIVPELMAKIQKQFDDAFDKSEVIKLNFARIRDGTATHDDSYRFARELGNILKQSLNDNLSAEVLPDGKMYYNIAERILSETLGTNYELISANTANIQTVLNNESGLAIKGVKSDLNSDKVKGIIDRVSNADDFEDIRWMICDPIENFSESIVDDTIHACADFLEKSGIETYVVRTASGGCCEWCNNLSGVYEYDTIALNHHDIWKRHESCHCQVNVKTNKYGKLEKMRRTGNAFIG